jgi:dynein heavy chain, axonemal
MDNVNARAAVGCICTAMHASMRQLAADFHLQQGRQTYTTPTSFLELLSTFKTLLAAKHEEISQLKSR